MRIVYLYQAFLLDGFYTFRAFLFKDIHVNEKIYQVGAAYAEP